HPGAHHFIAWIYAGNHGHLVTTRPFDFHELLPHPTIALAFWVFQIGEDEYRITIRRIIYRGRRQWDHVAVSTQPKLHLNKHARPELASGIWQRGLHLNVACGLIYNRINRIHAAGELNSRHVIASEPQRAADLDVG